jgi:hypothetical protein
MPTVPVINSRQVQARGVPVVRQDPSTSAAGGLAQAGRAIERTGDVLDGIAQKERDDADQAALLEADTGLDSWENANVLDAEKGAFTKKGKDAFDLPNQVLPGYDSEAKRIEGSLGSARAKQAFRAQAQNRRQQISRGLERHEFAERQAFYTEQDEAKLRSSAEMAGNYYNDPERIGIELGKQDAVIDSLGARQGWSPEQISEHKRAQRSNVHTDVVSRYIARGEFKKGKVYFEETRSQISADAATRIEAQFSAERDRVKTEVKQTMNDTLRDISAAAALGLPVAVPAEATLKAIYGEHEGAQRYKIAAQQKELSPQVAQMRLMSATELANLVTTAQPKTQEGAADQAQVAAFLDQRRDAILTERAKDPAGYVVSSSPAARDAWGAIAQAENPEQRDAATANYLRVVRAERERLQIKGTDVLPNAYAESVVDRINGATSAEALASDIEAEAQRWGAAWPQVYEQLAPKMSDTAAVIGSGIPRAAAVNLASVANLKEAELKALLPPGTKWSDIEESVASQFEDFQRSLPASATRMQSAFQQSATRLAARYMNNNESRSDAVKHAYRDLVLSQYQMIEFRGTAMRVPTTLEGDAAENGAAIALEQYAATSADLIQRTGGGTDEEHLEDFTDYVHDHGYWITNPSGTGIRLYVDGAPVPSAGGSFDVSWERLRALHAEAEAANTEKLRKESIQRQLAR